MDRAASNAQEQVARAEMEYDDRMGDESKQMPQGQNKDDQQRSGGGMKQAFDHLKQAAHEAREATRQHQNQ